MATRKSSYDDSEWPKMVTDKDQGPQIAIAGLEVVKVVREFVPLRSGGTATFGQLVDEYLYKSFNEGGEVQEVKLQFSPEQWFSAAEQMRKNNGQ